jgi:hypothetical protein
VKETSALGDERSLNGGELMADTWTLTFTDANVRVVTSTYDSETAFIVAVRDQLNDLRTTSVSAVLPDGGELNEKALGAKYGLSEGPRAAASPSRRADTGTTRPPDEVDDCQLPASYRLAKAETSRRVVRSAYGRRGPRAKVET